MDASGACRQHVGKSFKVYANDTKFQLGIQRSITAGWAEPKLDMGPPIPYPGIIIPTINCKAITERAITTYSNKIDTADLGSYEQTYSTLEKTVLYPLVVFSPSADLIFGLGYTVKSYALDIPFIIGELNDVKLNLRNSCK